MTGRGNGGGDLFRPRYAGPPSPKGEGFGKARRTRKETVLTVQEAAAIIRTAFGKEEWMVRARGNFEAATLVAALWVAQNDSGKKRLRDLIGWAWRLK